MVKSRKWDEFELTKPTNYSAGGSGKETNGRVKGAEATTKKSPKGFTVHTSKAELKKIRASTHKMPPVYVMGATNTSRHIPPSTTSFKSKDWVIKVSRMLSYPPTSTAKKTEKPRRFTGLKSFVRKPIWSIKDVVVIAILVGVIRYVAEHLIIHWK